MNEDIFCTIKSLLIKAHIVKGRGGIIKEFNWYLQPVITQ